LYRSTAYSRSALRLLTATSRSRFPAEETVVRSLSSSPSEDFDSLLETLEILSDRSAVADIREAEQQMAQGLIFSQEQVRAAVTNRRLP
jgi:hypothetical protein